MRKNPLLIFTLILFTFVSCEEEAPNIVEEQKYSIVQIFDGDSFIARSADGVQQNFRLYGIDAPEKDQPFGDSSRMILQDLLSTEFLVVVKDIDQFERQIIIAHSGTSNINEAMLRRGAAWHYVYYDQNPAWSALEASAREEKRGLWREESPVAPWEWRQ